MLHFPPHFDFEKSKNVKETYQHCVCKAYLKVQCCCNIMCQVIFYVHFFSKISQCVTKRDIFDGWMNTWYILNQILNFFPITELWNCWEWNVIQQIKKSWPKQEGETGSHPCLQGALIILIGINCPEDSWQFDLISHNLSVLRVSIFGTKALL